MSIDSGQGDEWGISGVQKVRIEFSEDWAVGFTTDVEDGHLIEILAEEHSIDLPDSAESSGNIRTKRTPTGWTVVVKCLYDSGNKEESIQFEVNDVSVQILE